MKDLIIIGASGFGREVAWLVERINKKRDTWNLLGYLDDGEDMQNKTINSYPVLGMVDDIGRFPDAYFVVAVGSASARSQIVDRISYREPNVKYGILIDPSVEMSDSVKISDGAVICAHTIMTVNITIGRHVIINLDCTIGHDAVINDFVTVYPSVNISGNTEVGSASELGTGTQIIQGKKIGTRSIVGAGSVVVKDIPEKCTAVGAPAKPIKFFD